MNFKESGPHRTIIIIITTVLLSIFNIQIFFSELFHCSYYIYTAIYTYIVVKKKCKQNKNQQERQQQ